MRPLARLSLGAALAAGLTSPLAASHTPPPSSVTLAGSLQSELGCPGDWQPECAVTHLSYDASDDIWQRTFDVPAGDWDYKAPVNDTWSENYGRYAQSGGPNIPLSLSAAGAVKFYYDHKTHWITSSRNAVIATVPGSFQSELGCPGDWQPDCLRSWLQDPEEDGIYTFVTASIPAGSYEAKVAIDESWDENYGAGGVRNGANIPFSVGAGNTVTFTYDAVTHVLTIAASGAPPQPGSVTIPGSLQSELGCPDDWQPECPNTHLAFDKDDLVWQASFSVPAGNWEYKAALNDSWDENYGQNATRNGPNIPLSLGSPSAVKFYYSHETHWVTSNRNAVIATAPGSFQSELGCPGDWDPGCLRSWLQDPDGDGIYTFATRALPPGNYEAKAAINESWDENYGAGGVQNGPNIPFTVAEAGAEMFFSYNAVTHVLTISAEGAPRGDLGRAQAHWVSDDTVLWKLTGVTPDWTVRLHYSPTAELALDAEGVQGGTSIPLTYDPAGPSPDIKERFPHLASYAAFHLPADRLPEVPAALKGQVAVSARNASGPVDATALQIPGVLDDLYTYTGPLGPVFDGSTPTLKLWAPTAQAVSLLLYDDARPSTPPTELAMTADPATGVWSIAGNAGWYAKYYRFKVRVFVRGTRHIEDNLVTDPYSVSLSVNSQRSQIIDLSDPAYEPAGWGTLAKPPLAAPEDITLYELHVRDFSANDASVPASLRGTYGAFTLAGSNGMKHLAALAAAGLTHVHLLPAFDIASVDEDRSTWLEPAADLPSLPPDSPEQQAAVMSVADRDGFNWGYDPWHYNVPDGSYAGDPDGPARIREFREMVKGLGAAGLRVVMDVVYNHTSEAGQNNRSVLDRVVPGYYHRLDDNGNIQTSTCCQNTASEHNMMEKLLVDSALLWARHYKVDGFRFDIMGHHMKRNMLRLRAALDALTPERDGVDGRRIYIYGEGWNFGEVANNARGVNATQINMSGTGIGTFNDRLRDGARGGGPFSSLQEQGFLTGLFYDPNATDQGSPDAQRERLLLETDWVKVGLAGSLADYRLLDRHGNLVAARDIDYNGQPTGYTADPQEVINYVEAHDNETFFDVIQLKAPVPTSPADRVRMQNLGMSLVGLGQGLPFFHAGMDLLRSKSLDRNSYNSGDWFNRLDFTYESNNWGVGLPPAPDNEGNWPLFRPLLANPALKVAPDEILDAAAHFREVLALRRSSRLFRLRTAGEIGDHLSFRNAGPDQIAGLVVMTLSDAAGDLDRRYRDIAVLLNANDEPQTFADSAFRNQAFVLHPLQVASHDPIVRTASFNPAEGAFAVPGRTTGVFVRPRPALERTRLLSHDVEMLVAQGFLTDGRGKSLLAKLGAAAASLEAGHEGAAANQLGAFVNEVLALIRSHHLPVAEGQALAAEAEEIVLLLGG
jgi:pullulanase